MRLFFAIDPGEEIKEYIYSLSKQFRDVSGNIKWVDKENYHLTLKFIGDVDDPNKVIHDYHFEPTELVLDKLGFFPSKEKIRVFWVSLEHNEKLVELHDMIDYKLSKSFNLHKDFFGHITLARMAQFDRESFLKIVDKADVKKLKFSVDSFNLYSSELTPKGPVYKKIKEFKS